MRRRDGLGAGTALAVLGAAGCGEQARPVGVVALPERSLTYAPLLLAVKRGLWGEPPVRLAVMQRADGRGVAEAVVGGAALVGAMALADLVGAVTDGAQLLGIGALTARLDCHVVVTTARSTPPPTLAAIHLGEWRGLRMGVESGADGTESFVRLSGVWSEATEGLGPRAPERAIAASDEVEGEVRWTELETDAALAAALADRRLEGFIGRPYAAAQALTYGSGQLGHSPAEGPERSVLEALPTVLVARRDVSSAGEVDLIRRIVQAAARGGRELTGSGGRRMAAEALPERDSLHLALAQRLMAADAATTAYALDGRLGEEPVRRYLELSATAWAGRVARADASVGALITNRFSG
ncbi:MAG TPA: hypothetical protein VFX49_11575 [Chloroflexota bacterium]|nr:hypothetical protein [Chloroflexota bacterium]